MHTYIYMFLHLCLRYIHMNIFIYTYTVLAGIAPESQTESLADIAKRASSLRDRIGIHTYV
jgi:hypothetical protein